MLMTLRPQAAPNNNTCSLTLPTAIKPARLAQTQHASGDASEPAQAPRPLAKLPSLPAPRTMTVAPKAASTNGGVPEMDTRLESRRHQERLLLRETFQQLRTGERTMWQKLSSVASAGAPSLFTAAVREPAPNWSSSMVTNLVTESNFERWSLLPGIAERARSLSENRDGPLTLVPTSQQVVELNTTQQYNVTRSAQREHDFAKLKLLYGSRYAFHGSLLRNWHQILTQGLEPKSGTALQANGATHGHGVYVATDSKLSEDFMGKSFMRVLGLVEVINHPSVAGWGKAWIVPSKVFVALRVIAVYENGDAVPDLNQRVLDLHFASLTNAQGLL